MRLYNYIVNNIWYNKNFNKCFCVDIIFKFLIDFRKFLYKHNIFKIYKFNIPIIVVGNITVGGTGKTPLVIYIVNYLVKQGFKPAIVTRGYKAKYNNTQMVTTVSDPILCGDEPVLLAKATNCPVIIGNNRGAAIKYLLKNFGYINVVISDDGLQHYSLARDLEIAVIDGSRLFGNGHLLPFGPLREPIGRLATVQAIIINGHSDSTVCLNYDNKYIIKLLPNIIYNIIEPKINNTPQDFLLTYPKIHAVAGLGNNQRFFESLIQIGFNIVPHEFPDHYNYKAKDLEFGDNLPIVMTEKDAIKCLRFAKNNFWCQTITVGFNLPQKFNNFLINNLKK